ncbi:hypothetical protein PN462_02285 [Spirulina sp. CS-785/01]|uniref:hypothetical protein n=1 Tax=Spirulina sp. CS-785/01 TaxID=3021716 RepID=UPI0023312E9F|nr:hypothetical protein [Spirulina sp. CS-785/01]MDB9311915.1 hypothetical protein [Spirulina sp. CS-785/01]
MNTKLVDSLVQIIHSLTTEERRKLEEKLFLETSEVSSEEIIQLTQHSHSFDFLENEPKIYTLEDGEPV